MDFSFFFGKTVLITGHTGFKGSWMCKILSHLGATVVGYSLPPPTEPSLFEIANIGSQITSITGDVRDLAQLKQTVAHYCPNIIFHMAAQPLVREGYRNPAYTYATNVMGTVNLLEAVRQSKHVQSVVNITTDKVYENQEWVWGYRENDHIGGYDPYSNSKSCSELVTETYRRSYPRFAAISTARAGNVIGGGDFAADRILPDCVRAVAAGKTIILRNPSSVRPYQHVLEPIFAYLLIAQRQFEEPEIYQGAYNIGPDSTSHVTTAELANIFCHAWGDNARWEAATASDYKSAHESNLLTLDCSKMRTVMEWQPKWNIHQAVEKTVEWSKVYALQNDPNAVMERQIRAYLTEVTCDI